MKRYLTIILALGLAACDAAPTEVTPPDAPGARVAPVETNATVPGPVSGSSGIAVVGARKERSLVCHVGSEEGPNGETYDPDCVPGEANDYFCPDAGKIDLISVPDPARHIGNPSHSYGGRSDYEPVSAGATGEEKGDLNRNGVADGCELPADVTCPCFTAGDLEAFNTVNLSPDACTGYFSVGGSAVAIFDVGTVAGYTASPFTEGVGPSCGVLYPVSIHRVVTRAEADVCVSLIESRCAEIED